MRPQSHLLRHRWCTQPSPPSPALCSKPLFQRCAAPIAWCPAGPRVPARRRQPARVVAHCGAGLRGTAQGSAAAGALGDRLRWRANPLPGVSLRPCFRPAADVQARRFHGAFIQIATHSFSLFYRRADPPPPTPANRLPCDRYLPCSRSQSPPPSAASFHRPQCAPGQPCRRSATACGAADHRGAAGLGGRAGGAVAGADAGKGDAGGGQRQYQAGGARAQPFFNDPFFRRLFPDIPQERINESLGSGVIIDAREGLVLTNHHVIDNADDVQVTGRRAHGESGVPRF